ncbi:hypothetical protein YPPY05_4454, partial [Yersinia pestis PY-05]
MGFINHGIA